MKAKLHLVSVWTRAPPVLKFTLGERHDAQLAYRWRPWPSAAARRPA